MRTIIAIGVGWLTLGFLLAWAWSRAKRHETTLLRDRDTLSECEELCPKFEMCPGVHDCLLEPGPDAYDEEKEIDFVARRSKMEADREDAEEGRQERLREKKEGR